MALASVSAACIARMRAASAGKIVEAACVAGGVARTGAHLDVSKRGRSAHHGAERKKADEENEVAPRAQVDHGTLEAVAVLAEQRKLAAEDR